MATVVGNLVAKVSMDQTGFQQGISKLNRELKVVQSEFKASSAQLGDFGKSTEGLKLKADSLTKQFELQKQRVQALEGAYKKSVDTKGADAKATQNLEIRLNKAKAEMAGVENELKKTTAELEKQSSAWHKVSKACQETGGKMADMGKKLTTRVTLPLAALGTGAAKSAIDMESAFAGVRKTVDATEEEFAQLRQGFIDMSKEIPIAAEELMGIGEAAGQLGIKKEAILGFTDTMAKLGVATNLSGEQAAMSLARLANIMQMPQDQFDRLGATIVDLGNNLATTEAEIVEMGLRLAGAGNIVGMTEAQVLALGGALSSVGIAAEAGGTAFSRVMLEMNNQVASDGANLQTFAMVAGMSAQEFAEQWRTNAAGALVAFIEGLGKIKDSGQNVVPVLDQLGLREIRVRDALLRAAGAGDLFAESLEIGSKAWEENNALNKEAEERFKTTASQLQLLKNNLKIAAAAFGDILLPAINSVVEGLKPVFDGMSNLSQPMKIAIIAITTLVAVIGPLLLMIGSMIISIGAISTALGGLAMSIGAAGGMAGVFGGVLAALTSPVALIIAGIAALTAAVVALYQNWDSIWGAIQSVVSDAAGKISDVASSMGETLANVWDKIGTGITVIAASITGLLLPKYIALAAQSVATAAKVVASWVSMAAGSTASATVQAVKAIPMVLKQLAALVVGAARTAVQVVASWTIMSAKALMHAARIAAAWIIAMGPVGWVGAAIAGLAALIATKTGWMAKAVEAAKDKILKAFQAIVDAFNKLKVKLGGKASEFNVKEALAAAKEKVKEGIEIDMQIDVDDMIPSFDDLGAAASGAGSKMKAAAEKAKTAWTGTAEALKSALSTLQTQHETEMLRAEMAGDKVAVLRLKHSQLNEELEKQKQVVVATRAEVDKAIAAGVMEGETKEDLAKRIDELNKKLVDEEKAQASLEKQVYDTNESIKAQGQSAKDLVTELKKVAETYQTDMVKALEGYQAKVKETNDKLREDTEKLQRDLESKLDDIRARGADRERQVTDQFQRELENRTRALTNFVGLFDEVTQRAVSGDTLLRNLEGQVTAFDDWQESIATLAARGIDEGLLQELREMGPKAGPEIAALNTLTDEQLTQYVTLWKQKQEQAKKEATEQLAQQRQEMNGQLSAIRQDTQNQLEQQRQEMAQKLQEMQAKAKEELEKYKLEWEKKNEEIRKNTEKNIKDIHDKFNDLVGKSSGYGVSLMENFMDGIDSMMPSLIAQLESMAAMIDSYMPHSPAKRGPLKRLNEWGPALVGTFAEGIKRSLPSLENVTARMAMLSPGVLQPAVANSYSTNNVNYNQGGNKISITVQDGEDLLRTLHRLGVRIP